VLAEPRLAARWHLSDELTVNVGASRAYQALSTLRDDRHNLPGAPLWLLHPRGAPLSRTDGASAAIEGWRGHAWSYSASVYGRRFGDVVRWRPVGARDLATLAFDDGHALGAEFFLRRHAGRATGWIGYGFGRVRLQEAEHGLVYDAAWDRRHALDVALFVRAWERLSLSGRFTYGTGLPFGRWWASSICRGSTPCAAARTSATPCPSGATLSSATPATCGWTSACATPSASVARRWSPS
jgi:hypothetical protein